MRIITDVDAVDGHILTEVDGRVALVDTGAPKSVGPGGAFELCGVRCEPVVRFMDFSIDVVRRHVSPEIDLLVGADVLSKLYFDLRWRERRIEWSSEPMDVEGERLQVSDLLGVPIVEATVGGHSRRLFLDTGAKLSYANDEIVAGLEPTRRERDFYPGFGTFETEVYEVPVVFGGIEAAVPCGVLPPLLRLMLLMGGAQGILGTAIFEHADVTFALPEAAIVVR